MKLKLTLIIGVTALIALMGAFFIKEADAYVYHDNIVRGQYIPGIFIRSDHGSRRFAIQARILHRASDWREVYCTQPGVAIDSSVIYEAFSNNQWEVQNIPQEAWQRANLIAYYGYGYANHTDPKWWAITQVMIWWVVAPDWDIYFADRLWGNRINAFVEEIAKINALVENHLLKPSFANSSHYLTIGESLTMIDNNNVLMNYEIIE